VIQTKIQKILKDFSGNVAVYYRNLSTGETIEINANQKWEGASCLKVFVLVELLNRVRSGELKLDQRVTVKATDYIEGSGILKHLDHGMNLTIKDLATLMMIVSDNVATNILMDMLGIESINKMIKSFGLKQTVIHNKIDWTKTKFCTFTAKEYGDFFQVILRDDLAMQIMRDGKYQEMIKSPSMQNSKDVKQIISKSGKVKTVRNDGGVVCTTSGNYIFVVLLKDFDDPDCKNDGVYQIGLDISELCFNHFINTEVI